VNPLDLKNRATSSAADGSIAGILMGISLQDLSRS
jgi:hypothetical protein